LDEGLSIKTGFQKDGNKHGVHLTTN
jgi:hypothetical protein